MPRTKRIPITDYKGQPIAGIFRVGERLYAKVQVGSGPGALQAEKSFELATSIKEIQQWQESKRLELRKILPTVTRGSLAGDVPAYLKYQTHKASYAAKKSELGAWSEALGSLKRHQVTGAHIAQVIAEWLAAGVSKKTIVNRCRTLHHLYVTLADDKRARTPLDNVEIPVPEKRRPRDVPAAVIVRTEKGLREAIETARRDKHATPKQRAFEVRDAARARGRFMVMAAAGVRPSQMKRIPREGVDLKNRIVEIPPGKGGLPIVQAMNNEQFAAWSAFVAADSFGSYDDSRFRRRLRAAGWPEGLRPYNTKHAVGIRLAEAGAEYQDIADHFGQTNIRTAKIYTGTPLKRLRRTAELLGGRFGWEAEEATPRTAPRSAPRKLGGTEPRNADLRGNSRKAKSA